MREEKATRLLAALQCSWIKSVVELGHVMVIIDLLLLLAGDVELNPGPRINDGVCVCVCDVCVCDVCVCVCACVFVCLFVHALLDRITCGTM